MMNNTMIGVRVVSLITIAIMGVTILTLLKSKKREFLVLAMFCTAIYTLGDSVKMEEEQAKGE